jgi:hypothetical protein
LHLWSKPTLVWDIGIAKADLTRYLQDLPLYKTVKPYWGLRAPRDGFDPDHDRVDNLEFETCDGIRIKDIRSLEKNVKLKEYGFQVLSHASRISAFTEPNEVAQYKSETEQMLQTVFAASFVKCYDLILRKNVAFKRTRIDLKDLLHTEGPARGAHSGKF